MKKKRLFIPMLLTTSILLTACNTDELEAQIAERDTYILELEETIENGVTNHTTGGSSIQVIDGTMSKEMKYIDQSFVFPTAMRVEGTTEDYNNTALQLGSSFKIVPSNNWISKIQGVQANFSHPLGIIGTMKALNAEDFYLDELATDYKTLSASFVQGIPTDNIKYSNLYLEDSIVGAMATTSVKMELERNSSFLVTGFVHHGENALSFAFLVDSGDNNNTAMEMVRLLVSSIKKNDVSITIE